MRVFGFEITRPRQAKGALTGYVPSSGGGWTTLIQEAFPGAWQRNVEVRTGDVIQHPTVFRCVSLIASDVAKLRLKLMERAGAVWQERDSTAFSPVLRKPNGYQTRIQFFANWIASKLIHGNTYILKEFDNRNVVVGLHVLDPLRTRPFVSPMGDVFYQVGADNLAQVEGEQLLPARMVIHDHWNEYFHPLMGLSPITACGLAAVQGLRIQTNSANFFGNQATPSGILTAPGVITKDQADELKARWQEKQTSGEFGKVAVLGNGLSFQSLQMNAVDAQLIDQLRWSSETVAGCFGVPAYKLGIGQPPNFNNVAALNDQYYSQALQIHIEAIEVLLDEGLALPSTRMVQFDLDALLRMDPMAQVEACEKGVGAGIWSPNEARAKFNMMPVAGGASPYLQQQNFSLEALAARDDAVMNPPEPRPAPVPQPTPEPDDPPVPSDEADEEVVRAHLTRTLRNAARKHDRRLAA